MCGILGSVGLRFEHVQDALQSQAHRGPDDNGIYTNEDQQVTLGHNRLSILDTSNAGHQPFIYQHNNRKFVIVFNGEIYNYLELKQLLVKEGYAFTSNSDTEVVIASFCYWGSTCVTRFRGMFAFAVWDEMRKELYFARDRMGIKPFLYNISNNTFSFASELRTLLAFKSCPTTVNKSSLIDYLTFGSIRQPKTLMNEISWLPKGHFGTFSNGNISIRKYWDLYEATEGKRKIFTQLSYEEAREGLRAKIEEATRYHLMSDVEIGAFLSGGIDSTAVVGLMKKYYPSRLHTFTLGFSGNHRNVDESALAKKTSDILGTTHHQLTLSKEYFNLKIKEFFKSIDQPSIDGFNTFLISELASKHVKVVLTGLGGDELFYGYNHFRQFHNKSENKIANKFLNPLKILIDKLPGRVKRYFVIKYGSDVEKILLIRRYFSTKKMGGLLISNYVTEKDLKLYEAELLSQLCQELKSDLSLLQNLSLYEINNYLCNTLLRDADVASMSFGLELRPILIDHELVEFAFALPDGFKHSKRILIDSLFDVLPGHVVSNPKNGFELPYTEWLMDELNMTYKYFDASITTNNHSFVKHAFYLEKYLEGNAVNF